MRIVITKQAEEVPFVLGGKSQVNGGGDILIVLNVKGQSARVFGLEKLGGEILGRIIYCCVL